jgi:hypothetical protein
MRNRIDIFRDGVWYSLRLKERHTIKYNAVINKVGSVTNREISHSNTFSIPNITENQKALGLNVFNASQLAAALNSKYIARYYVGDKIIKEGFIVINNSDNEIKLNFLDGALGIVDKWKSTTFKELLTSSTIDRPADYQTAIDEMSTYDMTIVTPFPHLSEVGTRGHNLALFPNTLNQVGDNFQKRFNGLRQDDVFIPKQSRPVFNNKSVFDLASESFGYTPTYDPSIDWDKMELKFFSGNKPNEGSEPEDVSQTIVYPTVASTVPYVFTYRPNAIVTLADWKSKTLFKFSGDRAITGNFLQGATVTDLNLIEPSIDTGNLLQSINTSRLYGETSIFQPDLSGGNVGTLVFDMSLNNTSNVSVEYRPFGIWETTSSSTDYVVAAVPLDGSAPAGAVQVNKNFLDTPPASASGVFKGILLQVVYTRDSFNGSSSSVNFQLDNMRLTETAIPSGEIVFGEFDEYPNAIVDLTHAATDKTVKDLLSSLMHQAGVLMNIDSNNKTIKFFSYGHYQTQKESGNVYNWSDYYLKGQIPKRNTDYGKNFGKLNRIGLKNAYSGNTFDRALNNYSDDSKYKTFSKDEVKEFKDVKSVKSIGNTNSPYFEFEVDGMAMVELIGEIDGLTQKSPSGGSQGTLNDLSHVANVSYYSLPYGVAEWYNLVDRALRVVSKFLLPVNVIKTLDITKPVYVNDLGGYYIIEQISEYVDSKTAVNIKLIRLVDNLRES